MTAHYSFPILLLAVGIDAIAAPALLKGTAKNMTTARPAANDEVVLLSIVGSGAEIGRTRTDSGGSFEFKVAGREGPYVVHVRHDGVVYQKLVPAHSTFVDVQVYDVVKNSDEAVVAAWGVERLQTSGDILQVIDEITLRNASDPPRTVSNDHSFEVQLPPGAELVAEKIQVGDEPPVVVSPTAGEKDRYYFSTPLIPGDTRFAIAYRMRYHDQAVIQPVSVMPMTRFVVVVPESMKFEAKVPGVFQPLPDKPGVRMYATTPERQSHPRTFRISGSGRLPESDRGNSSLHRDDQAQAGRRQASSGETGNSHTERWFLLGGSALTAAAAAAGILSHRRRSAAVLSR